LLAALRRTQWFASNAEQDTAVYMPALPVVLASDYPDEVDSVNITADASIVVRYVDGEERRIRFPTYAEAGHAVTAYAPVEIHADFRAWLEGG
jgi:hypothetical protein